MTNTLAMDQVDEALRLSQNSQIRERKREGAESAVERLTNALDSADITYQFVAYNAVPDNAELIAEFENIESDKLQTKAILLEGAEGMIVFQVGIRNPFSQLKEQDDLTLTAYIVKEESALAAAAAAMGSLKFSSPVTAKAAKSGARVLALLTAVGAAGFAAYKLAPKYYHWSGCYVSGPEGEGPYDPIECRGLPEELLRVPSARTEARSLQQRGMESWDAFWKYDSDLNGAAIPLKDGEGNVIEYRYEGEYVYPPMMGSSNIIPMVFPQNFAEAVEADQITILDLPPRQPQTVYDKASNTFETDNGIATANVYFETGVTSLTNADKSDIQNFITLLLDKDIDAVTLYGQTDTVGTTEQNELLAAARIESVRSFFEEVNIEVRVVNRGEQGDFEGGEAHARKVEIVAQNTLDLVLSETSPQIILFDSSVRAISVDDRAVLMNRLSKVPQVFQTNNLPALVDQELQAWSAHNLAHPFLAGRDGMQSEIEDLLAYVDTNRSVYLGRNAIDRTVVLDESGFAQANDDGSFVYTEKLETRPLVITILGNAKNTGDFSAEELITVINNLKQEGLVVVVNYYVDQPLAEASAEFATEMRSFVEATGGAFFETQ